MELSNFNNDRTVNRIAFCSAVVAGFAYVGYSVVRNAFSRKKKRRDDMNDDLPQRIFLRRLSQTTQTDGLLGDLDLDGSNRINLRPMSVQERIKELNVRARQFADAVVAIQSNGSPRPHGVSARSLQPTPWASPRLLSPVDIRHIVPELYKDQDNPTPLGSPNRHRWNRGSFKCHTRQKQVDFNISEDNEKSECDKQNLEELQEEVMNHIQSLLGAQRALSLEEAHYLVTGLNSKDKALITGILTTIANCSAFTISQDALREAGLLTKMPKLLLHPDYEVKQKSINVVNNMALNEENNNAMRSVACVLVHLVQTTPLSDSPLLESALSALTNVAVLTKWHKEIGGALFRLYNLLDDCQWGNEEVIVQSLRLLINLSCNDDMITSLLAVQAPTKLIYMLDISKPDKIVLRLTTLLANVATAAKRMKIDPAYDLPSEYKAAAPDTMYASIFGLSMVERLKRKAEILGERHHEEDVRNQAYRLVTALQD